MKHILLAASLMSLAGCGESVPADRPMPIDGQLASGVPKDPTAVGYLNLERRHPDAVDGIEEFNSYSPDKGLQALAQMRGLLDSFGQLTELAGQRLTEAELRSVGNTSPAMQTIGFHNIPLGVEGTIVKQDYQLRQAEYELAQLKRARNEGSVEDLDRARSAYETATKRFQSFWDNQRPTD